MANNLFLKTSINGAENVKNSLRGMRNTMKDVTSNTKKMAQTNKSLGQSFRNLNKDVNRNGVAMGNLSKIYRGFSVAKTIGQIYLIGRVLAGAIESTMDMIETQNLFNVSMGSMAEATGEYLANMSAISGLDLTNLKNSVGTYSLLARSMGFTNEQASKLSVNTNNLALDLASLTNVPIAQVMGDLRSGLLGQSETVYKYGIDVTEAAIKAEAMAQGITKSVRNMSQGEKMALRYSVMIKQTALAHGDFAKTIEEPANQMRILKERVVTLTRALGSIFLPVLATILPYLNAMAILLTRVFSLIAKFMGYVAPKDANTAGNLGSTVEESMNDAGGAVGGATKKLKEMRKYLLGIDELNVIPENTDTGAGGGGGVGGLDASILPDMDLTGYDNMLDSVKTKADEIANAIQNAFKDFISGIDFEPLMNSFTNLKNSLAPFVDLAMGGLSWVWENVLKPLGKWTIEKFLPALINLLAEAFEALYNIILDMKPYAEWLWENFLQPLATWTGQVIITALENLTNRLKDFNEEQKNLKDNNVFQSDGFISATGTIAGLATAIGLIWTIGKIMALPGALSGIGTAISGLSNIPILGGMFTILSDKVLGLGVVFGKVATFIAGIGVAQILIVIAVIALMVKAFVELWQENEEFRKIFEKVWDNVKMLLQSVWDNVLEPIFWAITEILKEIWEDGLKPLWEAFKFTFGEIAMLIADTFNVIAPILDILLKIFGVVFGVVLSVFKTAFVMTFNVILSLITSTFDAIGGGVRAIRLIFEGIINFIVGVFTSDWKRAWEGVVGIFKGIFNGLTAIVRVPLNFIINALNTLIKGVNKFEIKIPDWVAELVGFKGGSIGFNIPLIPNVPRFARGGFAEGGGLFQAGEFGKAEMIGNYGGKTTVMPLENTDFVSAMYDAIYSATIDAMSQNGGSDDKEIVLRMNEYTLGKATIKGINRVTRQDGKLGIEGI